MSITKKDDTSLMSCKSLMEYLESVDSLSINHQKKHKLIDILVIALVQ